VANEDQLVILKSGVDAWSAWRATHAAEQVNLYDVDLRAAILNGADLRRANLIGADLRRAALSGALLNGALLRGANLSEANLSGADLSGAHLNGALLNGANLSKANLVGALLFEAHLGRADLNRADLRRADLDGADLSMADLREANLSEANLGDANLSRAHLSKANLVAAVLREANLTGADLRRADLDGAYLVGAVLNGAHLNRADLSGADLRRADLSGARLQLAALVSTHLEGADLRSCRIYGIAAWDLKVDQATKQADLIITPPNQPTITVDNLEVAQFVYLLLNNQRIRQVIDTITSKVVLILGRFTENRKAVLDALRDELRRRDYLPIVFDFDKPANLSLTETIKTLAGMARFVIADLTEAKSLPQELMAIVPTMTHLAVQPLLLAGTSEYAMFEFFRSYPWVLPIYEYASPTTLLDALAERVVAPAEAKVFELRGQSPR
jgi:uncharacterized protein YjbI with pentapeptide repeats